MQPEHWIALAGVLVGLAGIIGSTTVTLRGQVLAERTRIAEQAAAVLAPVYALLIDFTPSRVAFNASPESRARLQARYEEWRTTIRESVIAASVRLRDEEARIVASDLAGHVTGVVTNGMLILREMADGTDVRPTLAEADKEHLEASGLANRLGDLLRGGAT